MISILKNSAITFASRILIFLLGLIASIILARVLGPNGRGIYALIVLIPGVMLKLGSLGIGASNVYFTGSKKYDTKEITSNSLILAFLIGLILILIFWGISHIPIFQNFLNSNQINPLYLWLVIFTIPLFLLFEFMLNIFLGKEEIVKYNKINIFQSILKIIAIVIFLLILKQGVFGAVISYILTIIGATLLVVILLKKINRIKFSLNRSLLKEQIKYGLRCYFGNLTQFLNYRLDMFLVAVFLAPTAVGFYSIAVEITERLWVLPGAIATVLFPRISSLKDNEVNNITPKVARHTFFAIFVFSIILFFLAQPLIKILFGEIFLHSVTPLLILLPGIIALGGAKILTSDLAGRGMPQLGTYAAFISLGINIPLNLLLIPKWGISGAAFASSIAYILDTLVIIIAFLKISRKPWRDIIFIKKSDFKLYKNFYQILKINKK